MDISDLNLSSRVTTVLQREQIDVDFLVYKSDEILLRIRGFGRTALREVRNRLDELGLKPGPMKSAETFYAEKLMTQYMALLDVGFTSDQAIALLGGSFPHTCHSSDANRK
jgi:hypothetical protein